MALKSFEWPDRDRKIRAEKSEPEQNGSGRCDREITTPNTGGVCAKPQFIRHFGLVENRRGVIALHCGVISMPSHVRSFSLDQLAGYRKLVKGRVFQKKKKT